MMQHIALHQPAVAALLSQLMGPEEDAPRTDMTWVPKIESHPPLAGSHSPRSIFTFINNEEYNNNLWDLVTRSMPPYFSRKYHNINVDKILKDYPNDNYLSIMTVYSLWQEAFGLPLMSLIYKRYKTYYTEKSKSPPSNVVLNRNWSKECIEISKYIQYTWEGEDTKGWYSEDECRNALEFLFERCIQMQLPWKPILLHQWLTAALSQILIFEKDSIELLHVPISEELVDIAKSIFDLVRQLKERIMLGFAIFNQQVVDYPATSNPKLHHYILDEVVLPSIPILTLLCNGDAKKITDFLKKNRNVGTKLTYMPVESYTMNTELANLHDNFMYNFNLWSSKILPNLFPLIKGNIESLVTKLNTVKTLSETVNNVENSEITDIKPLSENEKCLLKISRKVNSVISNDEFTTIMSIINNKIIKNKKLVGVKIEDIRKIFANEVSKKKSRKYYLSEDRKDNIEIALRHALMYIHAYNMIVNDRNNKQDNRVVASQLISLQINIIEKEQLVRLTQILGLIFDVSSTPTENIPDVKSFNSIIVKVHERIKAQNRDVFWSQFPTEWKKDVEFKEFKLIKPEVEEEEDEIENENLSDVPGKLIPAFKNRIGRMIYNTAKNSFDKVDKGHMLNPNWTFVQNLLPVMVASLLRDYKNENDSDEESRNMLDYSFHSLMEQIFQLFEYSYGKWLKDDTKIIELNENDESYDVNIHPRQEWPNLNFKIHQNARHCIGIELIYSGEVLHRITTFDRIFNNLHDLARKVDNHDELPIEFLPPLNAWFFGAYRFTQILFHSAIAAYKIPIPGNDIPNYQQLSDVYFVHSVISELETVLDITKFYRKGDEEFSLEKSVNATFEDMTQLRFEMVMHAAQPDVHDDHDELIKKIKPKLLRSYIKLKEYRNACDKEPLKAELLNLLPVVSLECISDKFVVAISLYIENCLKELDDMILPILQGRKPAVVAKSKKLPGIKKKRLS